MTIDRVSTGLHGLDEILGGGLPQKHAYLLQGNAGTGKTTLAFQFLLAGVQRGEKTLYISILQSAEDIEEMAVSHGWDISSIALEILVDEAISESRMKEQNLLPSSEIHLNEVITAVKKAVERVQPDLVVFDSIEQFRLIAGNLFIYQQQAMTLLRLFDHIKSTSLFIHTTEEKEGFKTLAHGVINLQTVLPEMGALHRYINVEKMRSISFKGGRYPYRILQSGLVVFPPLPLQQKQSVEHGFEQISSGKEKLDTLFGGGLERGTACLLAGASGTGKSSIATLYAYTAAKRGEKVLIFLFDERAHTFRWRARSMGMAIESMLEQGSISLVEVNIGDFSAGELAYMIRREVEEHKTGMVILDSISGYYNAMLEEPHLAQHLHEMLSYLSEKKVLSLLVVTEHGLFGEEKGDVDVSYITDSVVILRRFENMGKIRLAISVIKKRIGSHEKTIRELRITAEGIDIGEPLHEFEGVLTGYPRYTGSTDDLLE